MGSLAVPPLAHALITTVGWREAYALMGLMVMVVTVPVVALFLKETPLMMGLLPDGEPVEPSGAENQNGQEQGMSSREALHTGSFWLICVAFFLVACSVIGCLVHLVPMLTDRGVSGQNAALAIALLGGASLLGGVAAGYVLDRFFASYVAVCFFGGAGFGIFFLWSGAVGGFAFVAAFLVGMGMGAAGQIIPYQVSRYFGLRAFGEIYSYALISFSLGGVVGPLVMGVSFDSTGSYRLVLGVFLAATLTAAALMIRLGPYLKLKATAEPTMVQ